ncbi:hypothetical protein [Hydrogenimonas cancrithermarum]|uniref:Uncharacterized protein n=1 Tax=Hydrogenimonas cancrithermarum TaxID=2993563 RepID=A0ABN6WTA3_9BACT|nr:hypothetical protein [Hydrogenimonas cancrithermarum]BDY12350.1 hypothetical protein HCR_06620 [Hydrogenimonas cancrithermarum]
MDENVLNKLKSIKSEMSEAEKRRKAEEEKRRKAKEEAESFEKMMQAEGARKL